MAGPEPRTRRWAAALLAAVFALAPGARAQDNPVFLDDSTLAADVLAGLPGLLASENTGEAVRLLQRLLDQEGDRLIAIPGDPERFESVRARVHRVLAEEPELLARYRTVETQAAEQLLEAGQAEAVERARLLTESGFDAALEVAADHLAAARFESARLTLRQLDGHPDSEDPARAVRAAALWREVLAYLPRPEVEAEARRWAEAAGTAFEQPAPVAWPESLTEPRRSPMSSAGGFELQELVDTPLCTASLREHDPDPDVEGVRRRGGRRLPEFPYMFPLVSGDTVYATDGLWIGAWDRYTLTPRWRTMPRGADNERQTLEEMYAADAYRRNRSRDIEEATSLSLRGRLLLTATGLVADGGRDGDPRLHALDAVTGRVLWSSYIDELDPQLDESSSRGPAVFEGDLAVVAVRKISQSRRFASAYLVGIDLADGSARWVRLAGSAGWLSYGGRGQWTDWPTLDRGIVYRVDELGVISAVEAGTGRFCWVLRLPGVESRLPSPRLPWAASRVIVDGETLLALSPNRRELLRIDRATGEILARRDTQPLGLPGYIFPHAGQVIAVAPARIATLPIADAESGIVTICDRELIPDPGIVGRVVAAGDRLLVPLEGGMGIIDLATLEPVRGVELEAAGNLIPLGQQLVTADNRQLHSYLVWDDAARVLRERVAADPSDSAIAITFAELAHRAGHLEAMAEPIDAALAALAADPLGAGVEAAQRRLFDLLLGALQGAMDAAENPESPAALDPPLLDGLAERMSLVAADPDEMAAYFLVRSRLHEQVGREAAAVADCQQILADPVLSGAKWDRAASSVRAEIDALARLDRILAAGGATLYAPFEAAARERFSALEGTEDAAAIEALARAYPRAGVALDAWLTAARLHAAADQPLAQDRALDRGVRCAEAMRGLGLAPDPALVGELLGERITALVDAGRLDTAAAVLAAAPEEWPGLALTADGDPLDRDALGERLRARADARTLRPQIGDALAGTASELDGWVLMRALDRRDAQAARPGVMLLGADRVGLFRVKEGSLATNWTFPTGSKASLLRFDPDRVLLFEPDAQGGSLYALDPSDGRELWRSDRLGEALARATGPALPAGPEEFESPLDGQVSAGDVLLAIDETTLAVVSRGGRVAAVDLTSGAVLWSRRTRCQQVADAAAGEGVLALGGTAAPKTGDAAGEPVVLVIDLASGEQISSYSPTQGAALGRVRWLHLASGSRRVVVGLSRGLAGLSLPEARPDWTLADLSVEQTEGAWSVGAHLFVQTSLRDLALVDAATGELLDPRLETAGVLALDEPVDAFGAGDRFVVVSPAGFASLDPSTGVLLAADAIEPVAAGMVQAAVGRERVVLVEREPAPGRRGLYRVHILDAGSGRTLSSAVIELPDRPRRVELVDGAVCITAGDSTIVAPTE